MNNDKKLPVVNKKNESQYKTRMFNIANIKFCSGLFGYMIQNEIIEFNIDSLQSFIESKLQENEIQLLFSDIDRFTVIQEGVTYFEFIGAAYRKKHSSVSTTILFISPEIAQQLIDSAPIEYTDYIEQLALEFKRVTESNVDKVKNWTYKKY